MNSRVNYEIISVEASAAAVAAAVAAEVATPQEEQQTTRTAFACQTLPNLMAMNHYSYCGFTINSFIECWLDGSGGIFSKLSS